MTRPQTSESLGSDFIYKSDHMEVNMGSRIWDLRTPAYGLEGHVEGFMKLLEEQAHVRDIEIRVAFAFDRSCAAALLRCIV